MPDQSTSNSSQSIFAERSPKPSPFPRLAVLGAAGVILLAFALLLFGSRSHPAASQGGMLPLDPQAATLAIGDLAMSESTSLSGGKSTFIDGHIRNTGAQTVSGITVQVIFRNDMGLAPQVETLPLQLIRTHEPYIDTQPISAAPLVSGETREFRLPFETINGNWNVQLPEIHIVRITAK